MHDEHATTAWCDEQTDNRQTNIYATVTTWHQHTKLMPSENKQISNIFDITFTLFCMRVTLGINRKARKKMKMSATYNIKQEI